MAIQKAKVKAQPVKVISDDMLYGATNIKELSFNTYSDITTSIKNATDISIEFITNKGISNSLKNYASTDNLKNNKLICGYDESKAYGVIIANGRVVSPRILSLTEETKLVNDIDESFLSFDYIEGNEIKSKTIQYTRNASINEASKSGGSGGSYTFFPTTKESTDANKFVTVSVTTASGSVESVKVTTDNIAQQKDIASINTNIANIYHEIDELKNLGDAVSKAGSDAENNLTIGIMQSPNKAISEITPTVTYAVYDDISKTLSKGIMTDIVTSAYVIDITSSFQSAIDDISINKIPKIQNDIKDISENRIPELKDLIDKHETRITTLENKVTEHDTSIKDHETRLKTVETTVSDHTTKITNVTTKVTNVSNALDDLIDKVNGFSHHSHNKISGNDSYVSITIDKTTDGNLSSTASISTTIASVNIGDITDTTGTITYAGTPGTGLTTATETKASIQNSITNFYKHTVNNKKYVPTSKIASDATLSTESYTYNNGNISLSDTAGKQTYKVTMNKVNPFGTDHGTSSSTQIQTVSISVIDKILGIIKTLDDRITALENADPVTPTPTTEYTPVFLTID